MGVLFLMLLSIGMLTACATTQAEASHAATPQLLNGTITFGSGTSPETAFRLDAEKEIAWTAVLAEPVEETSVNLVISRAGDDRELFGFRQFITDPEATTLVNAMPLGRFLPEPGVYVMRYVTTGGDVMAEGEFELIADQE